MSKKDKHINTRCDTTENATFKLHSISNLLKIEIISIDKQRLDDFSRRNIQIEMGTQPLGVKEEKLSEREIHPIATPELANIARQKKGSLGNAHSIYAILKECISDNRPRLILEDDTQLHPNLSNFISENWHSIKNLDILVLGGNTDAVMTFEAINGMPISALFTQKEDQHPDYSRISKIFSTTPITRTTIYKLHKIFGSHAWIVSPKGAKKLIERCFPLDITPIDIPLLAHKLIGISFDRRWNAVLREMEAGICIPFLAMTPNNSQSNRIDPE